jgi:hypothetical protein
MHLLYLNGDKTLHDCSDMDEKNIHFSDMIKVIWFSSYNFYFFRIIFRIIKVIK